MCVYAQTKTISIKFGKGVAIVADTLDSHIDFFIWILLKEQPWTNIQASKTSSTYIYRPVAAELVLT